MQFLFFWVKNIKAQYGDAYHAPDNYAIQRAADKRASDNLNAQYKSVAPSTIKSSSNTVNIPSSSSSSWGDGGAYQRRMAEYDKRIQDRQDAYNRKENRFLELSANVPKNDDNYELLVKLAMDAGFDGYSAGRINGLYAPKNDPASVKKRELKKFAELVESAEIDLKINDTKNAIYKLVQALNYDEVPYVRKKCADVLFFEGEFVRAFEYYRIIETSGLTPRPTKDENDYNTGKAALMADDYINAFLYLEQSWAIDKNYLNGLDLSYAYFLGNKYESAAAIMKEETVVAESFLNASLIENFFLLKKGDETTVKKFIEIIIKDFNEIKSSGNLSKDFASILQAQAKKNVSKERVVGTVALYHMDLAILLDAENLDLRETRFAFNTARKRNKQAAIDEAILNK